MSSADNHAVMTFGGTTVISTYRGGFLFQWVFEKKGDVNVASSLRVAMLTNGDALPVSPDVVLPEVFYEAARRMQLIAIRCFGMGTPLTYALRFMEIRMRGKKE